MVGTVTVGYVGMAGHPGWPYALRWQRYMFGRMNEGRTIRASFDMASQRYPRIATAVRFVGCPDARVR